MSSSHLTTTEAVSQKLPGSDVYLYSHLIYRDDLNRDAAVVQLCREAMKAFSDTIMIAHRVVLANEASLQQQWIEQGGILGGKPWPSTPFFDASLHHQNLENFKVAAGFELLLKGILIEKNYVISIIEQRGAYRDLSRAQFSRPIKKDELFGIDNYRYDGSRNYIPGLKKQSIPFSTLLQKTDYRSATGIREDIIDVIDEFRELRNQIHFPGDLVETPRLAALGKPIARFVIDFINAEIVQRANRLTAKHRLNWPMLIPMA